MTNTDTLKNVREFHVAFDCKIAESPSIPYSPNIALLTAIAAKMQMFRNMLREHSKDDPVCLRSSLAIEEATEEITALVNRDVKGLLDAYVDKDYIDKGSVLTFGLQDVYYEACERVHQSNLSKLVDGKPVRDEAGKIKKPSSYSPVVLDDLVDGTWLSANPPKQKTRFEKRVQEAAELNVTVLASSKYPLELDSEDFRLQSSSNQDELLELLEAPKYKSAAQTELEARDFDRVNRKDNE
jgi:predicted HAD superfamily Cof-like phosphohydrolase